MTLALVPASLGAYEPLRRFACTRTRMRACTCAHLMHTWRCAHLAL